MTSGHSADSEPVCFDMFVLFIPVPGCISISYEAQACSHHSWQAALHLGVRAVAVVVLVIPGRAGGRVGRAVGAGGHVGADLRELRCDELRKESEFSSSSLKASPQISTYTRGVTVHVSIRKIFSTGLSVQYALGV